MTAETKRPIPSFFWSRDSRLILYVKDNDGDENFNVWAVDPAAAKAEGKEVPPSRNLTDAKGARAFIYDVPKKSPDTIYVGLNDRDAAWHDVYAVSISTGKRELVRKNTDRIAGWQFDLEGRLRLAVRTTDKGDTEVLKVLPDGFETVYTCSVFETCGPDRFHKDGKRVYMQTNKGDVDLARLVLFDPETGKEELVESDPMGRVDFGNAIFSESTEELVGTSYEDDRVRVYFRDPAWEADYKLLQGKFPGKDITLGSSTADDRVLLITASSDTDPGERYLFDRTTKKLTLQYKVRERIPREHMAEMKAVRYPSSDGLEIPAFLTLPKGVPAKGLPAIVVPHGGPWARDSWGFNNLAQFLANRGYAVLQPNFRASTGYGKKHLNAGNRQWGDKMQDDITWGVKYLVAQGVADPKRVGIMGGSYGGYATLAGVAFTPDVYAAGVSIVGPSNLITLLESIPPYWEAGRIIFHERMGNPTTPEGKAQLVRQSPLTSAQKIKTPLLVAQGANDPRVKKAESEQIVIALRDRGFPVEYILAPDEGHGFQRPVNSMALWAASEAFFAKHIGGRFQEGATPEVATRLKEITVDPKTVVLSKAVDAAAVGVPKVVASLSPGRASYQGKIEAGGQTIPMSITQTIEEKDGSWVVTGTAKMPMGDAIDVTTLDKATPRPAPAFDQAGAGRDRAGVRGRQGHRHDGHGRRPEAGVGGPRRRAVRGRRGQPRCPRRAAPGRGLRRDLPQLRRAAAEGAAEEGEGGGLREGHRAGRDLRGLEGRDRRGRRRARVDDTLGRQGHPQGREDDHDASPDGRRRGHHRVAAVVPVVIPRSLDWPGDEESAGSPAPRLRIPRDPSDRSPSE